MSRPSAIGERLFLLFLLGVILFNPPLLSIFNLPERLAGIPLLYVFLFASWGVLLILAAFTIEIGGDLDEASETSDQSRSTDGQG